MPARRAGAAEFWTKCEALGTPPPVFLERLVTGQKDAPIVASWYQAQGAAGEKCALENL